MLEEKDNAKVFTGKSPHELRIKRDFEIKYQAEFDHVPETEGILVSKGYVVPHFMFYNIDPADYARMVHFIKTRAYNKGFIAFRMLLDMADAVDAAKNYPQQPAQEIVSTEKAKEPEKRITKVLGGKEYVKEVKE
jgi:hypothetical protein